MSSSFHVQVQGSREQLASLESDQLIYLLITAKQVEERAEESRVHLNLSLVIDRSTSMRGERLRRVQAAVRALLDQMSATDVISVVAFSDRAETIVPARRVGNKTPLVAAMNGLVASGGTEIYQGLRLGMEELRKVPISNQYLHHLLLLTDGHTYGDVDECLELARQAAERSVGMSAFGIGAEWNDTFLDQLVGPSGGISAYISDPQEIVTHLSRRIEGLNNVLARNAVLTVQLPPRCRVSEGFRVAPYAQPLSIMRNEVRIGAIEAEGALSVLLEVIVGPQPAGQILDFSFQLSADPPGRSQKPIASEVALQLAVMKKISPLKPPQQIIDAVKALNLHRMNEEAWKAIEAGQLDVATRRMQNLTARLAEAGHVNLARQAMLETSRLKNMGRMSGDGRKHLKYGTRALISTAFASGPPERD